MFRKTTWLALLVFFILLGIVLAWEIRQNELLKNSPTAEATLDKNIFNQTQDVVNIHIEKKEGQSFDLVRNEQGKWVLLFPSIPDVDNENLDSVVQTFLQTKVIQEIDVDIQPEVTGLKNPAYMITFTYKSGNKSDLLIGLLTPIQNGYYAKKDDEPLILVISKYNVESMFNWLNAPRLLPTEVPATQTGIP